MTQSAQPYEDEPVARSARPRQITPPGFAPARPWWQSVAIGALALAIGLGVLAMVWLLSRPLALFLGAVIIAEALAPLVAWLERWIPRAVGILLILLLMISIVIGMGLLIFPPLIDQAAEVPAAIPDLMDQADIWLDRLSPAAADQLRDAVGQLPGAVGSTAITLPLAIFEHTLEVFLVVVMAAYLLTARANLSRFVLSLVPPHQRAKVTSVATEMGETMGGYVRGAAIDGAILATIVYIGLTILDVRFALVLALISFLGEIVPVAGPIIAAVPAIAVAFLDSPTKALAVLVFYLVIQQFESY
ncbi:MAG TPA: AI-2E family transporter, partial [Chloroflexota bacterium]|nr:AI-2E family transporter [Chloroflexota bacterium]